MNELSECADGRMSGQHKELCSDGSRLLKSTYVRLQFSQTESAQLDSVAASALLLFRVSSPSSSVTHYSCGSLPHSEGCLDTARSALVSHGANSWFTFPAYFFSVPPESNGSLHFRAAFRQNSLFLVWMFCSNSDRLVTLRQGTSRHTDAFWVCSCALDCERGGRTLSVTLSLTNLSVHYRKEVHTFPDD